jgi:Beta-ketoacyl synthase, N-terminal domain
MRLSACIEGVGLIGPGISDWQHGARILRGESAYVAAATVVPQPARLPSAERRRTGTIVRLALAVGLEATANAAADPAVLPAVFTSSGGDGANCHEICQVLAGSERALSPTRFHNSVHNAASGYWGIATGATPASTALCAYDGSFGAGLIEALLLVQLERTAVLLVAYDASYPEPIFAHRPIPDAFGVALVLSPAAGPATLARLSLATSRAPAQRMAQPALEALRSAIPAARSLPLLAQLAQRATPGVVIDYLEPTNLALSIEPCR